MKFNLRESAESARLKKSSEWPLYRILNILSRRLTQIEHRTPIYRKIKFCVICLQNHPQVALRILICENPRNLRDYKEFTRKVTVQDEYPLAFGTPPRRWENLKAFRVKNHP